jgi:hypothetical protein
MSLVDALFAGVSGASRGLAGARDMQRKQRDAEAQQAEKLKMQALQQALLESQIGENRAQTDKLSRPPEADEVNWQTVEGAEGYVQVHPRTGQTRPLSGVRPKPPAPRETVEPSWQVVYDRDGSAFQVNPKTGETRPLQKPGGQGLGKPTPQPRQSPQALKTVAEANEIISNIGRVEKMLTDRPQSVGLKRKLPDFVLQRNAMGLGDPGGVPARAALANISSTIMLMRSGGAVSDAEFARLQPLLPQKDDTAEAAKQKLGELKLFFQNKIETLRPAKYEDNPF